MFEGHELGRRWKSPRPERGKEFSGPSAGQLGSQDRQARGQDAGDGSGVSQGPDKAGLAGSLPAGARNLRLRTCSPPASPERAPVVLHPDLQVRPCAPVPGPT